MHVSLVLFEDLMCCGITICVLSHPIGRHRMCVRLCVRAVVFVRECVRSVRFVIACVHKCCIRNASASPVLVLMIRVFVWMSVLFAWRLLCCMPPEPCA